jgi:hypothetical protein
MQVAGLGLGVFWDSRSDEDRLFEAGTHLKFYFERLPEGVDPSRLPLAEAFARENGCADGRSCYAEFKQALADVGINAKNAEGGSVLLVRQSDNPEQLTKEIVRQLGKGFEYEYQQSPVLQDMLAERITGAKPGSFINLSDFWQASVQETALRAYNHPGGGYFRDVVDNGGTIPIFSKMLGVPNFQSIVSNDELAPIAFRNYQDRSLGVDLVALLASSIIPFKGAGLTGGLGQLSFAEGRIGFAALKEAELSVMRVANSERQILNLRSVPAEQANAPFIEQGLKPPYLSTVRPREFTTASDLDFVRVHGPTNQEGVWMVRSSEIDGMSAADIQSHLGLKYAPTQVSPVTVSQGAEMRVGRVGPQPQWSAPSPQGVQYELLDLSKARFGQPRPLQ